MASTRGDEFEGRLAAESERYMGLLEELGAKLKRTLASDTNAHGTPTRDWARSFGHYSTGVSRLLSEQRERAKLKMLAGKAGMVQLSDEEYEREARALGLETMRQLPTDELAAELKARGIAVPLVSADDD